MTLRNDIFGEDSWYKRVRWRRVANVVGLVLVVAVVLPFLVYAAPQVVGADQSYVVLSGSMEPTISPGDAVIVESVPPETIQRGDVITFVREGTDRPTTHRVVDIVERNGGLAFETRGDANENADQALVRPRQVQGKVMSVGGFLLVLPFVGYIVQFASTPVGFLALFVVPLTVLVVTELWSLVSSVRDNADGEPVNVDHGLATSSTAGTGASEPGSTTRDREETADGEMTLTELQFGTVILGIFMIYSVWVAYATFEGWAVAVAVGSSAAFLVLAGLYLVSVLSFGEIGEIDDSEPTEIADGIGPIDSPQPDTDPDAGERVEDVQGLPKPNPDADRPATEAAADSGRGGSDD